MAKRGHMEGSNEGKSCCKKLEVPSEDELVALDAMRLIKSRVRDLKKRLSEISSSDKDEHNEEALRLEEEMAELKTKWHEWESKRERAATKRMILLGHEEVS